MKFKKKYSFEDRINESTRIIKKYPYRIPVICEPAYNCTFNLDKIKWTVPDGETMQIQLGLIAFNLHTALANS